MPLMLDNLLKKTLGDQFRDSGRYHIPVEDICVDSRQVRQGSIFLAIPGSELKGSKFITQAVERGASAAVVPREELAEIERTLMPQGFPLIPVADIRHFAGCAADIFYNHPSHHLSLVGITGTNGKTTVSWLLEAIFHSAGMKPGLIGTISSRFAGTERASSLTTPDAISLQRRLAEMVDAGADSCILEVSSHALDQKRVAGCRFKAAVFTNLSRDHLDYHSDIEDYFKAKKRLFMEYKPEYAVINRDDPHGLRLAGEIEAGGGATLVTFGLEDAMVRPLEYSMDLSGTRAVISTPAGAIHVNSRLIGLHNLYNILTAVAVAHVLGISHEAVSRGISALDSVPGRLEPVTDSCGHTAFVDYAHTPDALEKVLSNLKSLTKGRLIVVAGCGGDRDRGKRPLMAAAAASGADLVFLTSDNPRTEAPKDILMDMVQGIDPLCTNSHIRVIPDRKEAVFQAVFSLEENDCLLVAGKGHEDYQIIGREKRPFDDRKVITQAFEAREKAREQTAAVHELRQKTGFMPGITMADIAEGTGAVSVTGPVDITCSGISTDTRKIIPGQLFYALRGENFNGNRFAASALAAGASGVVVDSSALQHLDPQKFPDKCIIMVRDTLESLGRFASWYCRRCGYQVLGITGSCGKTSTRALVSSVAATMFPVAETAGNFNNLIGLPLSMISAPEDTVWGIFEMGMNQPGEMERLCSIAMPAMGIITNIRAAHLEGLGSMEAIAAEKWELWKALPEDGTAIVNLDDPLVLKGLKFLRCSRVLGWSLKAGGLDMIQKHSEILTGSHNGMSHNAIDALDTVVTCDSWRPDGAGTEMVCTISRNDGRTEKLVINLPLPGEANVQNALAAVAAGAAMHIPLEQIRKGLQDASGVPGRLEYRELANGWLVIMDFYNANPASMEAALATLAQWAGQRRKVAVLGDMLELGDQAPGLHRELGAGTVEAGVDMLIAAGEFAPEVAAGAREAGMPDAGIRIFPHTEDLCEWLRDRAVTLVPDRAALLVKGSRGMKLEQAVEIIEEVAGGRSGSRPGTYRG